MMSRQKLIQNIENRIEAARRLKYLNIFITETFQNALQQAHSLNQDGKDERTKTLSGDLIAVKDCFSTKNVLTTCASKMLSDYEPPYTATVVQKLFDQGAILLGKTNMDEFCMGASSTESYFGPVKNPWTLKLWKDKPDLLKRLEKDWYLAGGSSGGSAAAVAAGLVKIALGSDTGGSTRNPASFCGIVGLKPTYGLLSRHGLIPLTNSLDVPGIFAQTVDDAALALGKKLKLIIDQLIGRVINGRALIEISDVVAGKDSKDSTSIDRPDESFTLSEHADLQNLHNTVVGLPNEYFVSGLSEDVVDWWQRIAGLLEQEGKCQLKCVSLPHTKFSIICYHVLGEAEISSNMARYDGLKYGYRSEETSSLNKMFATGRQEAFNEIVRRRILAGNFFLLKRNYERYYMQSLKVRRLIAEDFYKLFRRDKVDILLTPVTLSDAPLYSEWRSTDEGYERERSDDYFTQPVNMAGIPSVTIPVGLSKNGLPVGLQLVGDIFSELKLLSVAKWIEKRVQFAHLQLNDILH